MTEASTLVSRLESSAEERLPSLGIPSAPAPQSRDFLQQRVALYLKIVLAVWMAVALAVLLLAIYLGAKVLPPGAEPAHAVILFGGCVAFAAGTLAAVRYRPFSERTLRFIEMAMTYVVVLLICASTAPQSLAARPEQSMLFVVVMTLLVRAAIIPSTARATAWVSTAAMVPVVGLTAALYGSRPLVNGLSPVMAVATVFINCSLAVVVTTTIAFVIYGLSERVQAAVELGQYTLLERIGAGGMGVVYRARHVLLRRPTAVKVLPIDTASEALVSRFEKEVQLTADLSHPNVVSIYDFGRSPSGVFYYAMEYIDGLDFQRLVEEEGPQPAPRVVHLLLQAADALAEAHAVGLIHRDIKPANLMLSNHARRPDHVKILDFGLATDLRRAGLASDTAKLRGTPLYMAPEAFTHTSEVDERSDLYALGAVAYWLLTGATPFTGVNVVDICAKHLYSAPEPLSARMGRAVPPALDQMVLACLAKKKEDRPQSAGALVASLRELALGSWSAADAGERWARRSSRPGLLPQRGDGGAQTLAVALRGPRSR